MRADLERAADMFRELGDDWALAMTLSSLAGTLSLTERARRAPRPCSTRRWSCCDELNGWTGAGLLRMRLAEIRARRGDLAGARERWPSESLEDVDLGARRGRSSCAPCWRGSPGWPAISTTLRARDGRRGRAAGAASARSGPSRATRRRWSRRCRRSVAMEDGDLEAARPRSPGARSRPRSATEDMPIVAMAGVVAATVAATGRATSRRPRRCSAPPPCCGAPRICASPEVGAAGGGASSSAPMSAPARSAQRRRARGPAHARRL